MSRILTGVGGTVAVAAILLFSGCTMPHGDATLSSRGDGLRLGGNIGLQVGGSSNNGGAPSR